MQPTLAAAAASESPRVEGPKRRGRWAAVVAVCVVAELVTCLAAPLSAHASIRRERPARTRPLRAGTIVDGEWATGPVGACATMPDCAAWLASGCNPALAGRNPALYSSIVDVADLADGVTIRVFAARTGKPVGVQAGGMSVQFWRADCRQVGWTLDPWNVNCHGFQRRCDVTFTISPNTRWMTVK